MKKLESASENGGFDLSKVVRQIVIAVIILILFTVLFATGQIIFLIQIFAWIETKVRVFTGLDALLAKGLAALIMGGLLALPLWGFFFSFLPVPQKNKRGKRLIVMSLFALMFFASFFASQRVYFNPDSGKPMKYYSITPDGEYKFYSSDGYDPMTGDKLQPVTKDVAVKRFNKKKAADDELSVVEKWHKENRRLSEEEKEAIEKEKVIAQEKKVRDVIKSGGSIKLDIENPSGIEKTADFYQIKVLNVLDSKVFFFISAKIESRDQVQAFSLPAKSSININVCEGNHYFGFIDVNGDNVDRNTLNEFRDFNDRLVFYVNGGGYDSYYNHIIPVPEKKEIMLSNRKLK